MFLFDFRLVNFLTPKLHTGLPEFSETLVKKACRKPLKNLSCSRKPRRGGEVGKGGGGSREEEGSPIIFDLYWSLQCVMSRVRSSRPGQEVLKKKNEYCLYPANVG